jgi:hypothetical protein
MLSGIGDLFSTGTTAQPAAAPAPVATSAAPLPPHRGVVAKPVPQKRAQAPAPVNVATAQ